MFKSLLVMRETKGFFVAISPFDIGSLTALLAIFVCFFVFFVFCFFFFSEKGGSEKNHFDKWSLHNVQFCKTILSPHMAH